MHISKAGILDGYLSCLFCVFGYKINEKQTNITLSEHLKKDIYIHIYKADILDKYLQCLFCVFGYNTLVDKYLYKLLSYHDIVFNASKQLTFPFLT
jgi:hypothetical protein